MRRPFLLAVIAASAAVLAVGVLAVALLGRAPVPGAAAADPAVGARAFARVRSDGAIEEGFSRNVLRVRTPSTGIYCLYLSVTPRNVVASLNAVSAARIVSGGLVVPDGFGASCPAGADAVVVTRDLVGNQVPAPFYVLVH